MTDTTTFKRFLAGPLLTLAALLCAYFIWPDWNTLTLAPLFPLLAFSGFVSGLRANLVSAIFVSVYAYQSVNYSPERVIAVTLSVFGTVLIVGILHRQRRDAAVEAERNRHALELINAANGNLGRLREIHLDAANLIQSWKSLGEPGRFQVVDKIRGDLANVLLVWEGWHQLFKEREKMKWENLKRKLQEGHK
jgi:hypothetical protein